MNFLLERLCAIVTLKSFQFAYSVHVGHVQLQRLLLNVFLAAKLALVTSFSAGSCSVRCVVLSAEGGVVAEHHVTDLTVDTRPQYLKHE